ncbi:MAG TPA: dihydrolipoamide acetyltransferase family protein [Candidatus Atribacteria bacterium]|nr:dihydrolipoamide acetyltransferase family protein [Candidatus Atribacteria bacterium]
MAKKVIMPKLGLTMEEGVINKWLVKEGDRVSRGDVLFEVATDKVNMEVESPAEGVVLKILYPEGATVPITETVAYIGKEGEAIPEEETEKLEEKIETKEEVKVEEKREEAPLTLETERVRVSPLARRLAEEHGIDLSQIRGSGPGGRIVKEDIEKAIEEKEKKLIIEEVKAPREKEHIPLSRMRKIIAQRLTESYQSTPHFFLHQEIYAEELVKMREKILPRVEKETGLRVSYTDILVKMVAKALEKFPLFRAHLVGEEIEISPEVNVGVAVALEEGLVVPVVKRANQKGISQITQEINTLAQKAKSNQLTPEEISGGVFTVSNLGMWGVDSFTAIINPPEAAILACGAIRKKPFFNGEEIVPAYLWELSLSCDHRLIDGALAAQFMQFLKNLLEEPFTLIV